MKRHVQVRGVVVYAGHSGEHNSRIGLYTEEGLLYATAYGGKSLKSSVRGSDALLSMGRFSLEENKNGFFKIYDAAIYENCYALSRVLSCYYAACSCAEIVKYIQADDHAAQFKLLADALLFLSRLCAPPENSAAENSLAKNAAGENSAAPHNVMPAPAANIGGAGLHDPAQAGGLGIAALAVFLWRSLRVNGWQPEHAAAGVASGAGSSAGSSAARYWTLNMHEGIFSPSQKTAGVRAEHLCVLSSEGSLAAAARALWASVGVSTEEKNAECKRSALYFARYWEFLLETKLRAAAFLQESF